MDDEEKRGKEERSSGLQKDVVPWEGNENGKIKRSFQMCLVFKGYSRLLKWKLWQNLPPVTHVSGTASPLPPVSYSP